MELVQKGFRKSWLVWLIAVALYLFGYGVIAIPSVLTQTFTKDLNLGTSMQGIIATAFLISYVLMLVPVGALLDKYGFKRVLIASSLLLALGSVFFAVMQGAILALISRITLGIGAAGILLAILMIIRTQFHVKQFTLLVAITESIAHISIIIIPFVFTALENVTNWREVACLFLIIYMVIGLLILCVYDKDPVIKSDKEHRILYSVKHALCNKTIWLIALYVGCLYSHISVFSNMWRIPMMLSRFPMTETKAIYINAFDSLGFIFGAVIIGYIAKEGNKARLALLCAIAQLFFQFLAHVYANVSYFHAFFFLTFSYYSCLFLTGFFTGAVVLGFEFLRQRISAEHYGVASGLVTMAFGGLAIILIPLIGYILEILDFNQWWVITSVMDFITVIGVLALLGVLKQKNHE